MSYSKFEGLVTIFKNQVDVSCNFKGLEYMFTLTGTNRGTNVMSHNF